MSREKNDRNMARKKKSGIREDLFFTGPGEGTRPNEARKKALPNCDRKGREKSLHRHAAKELSKMFIVPIIT